MSCEEYNPLNDPTLKVLNEALGGSGLEMKWAFKPDTKSGGGELEKLADLLDDNFQISKEKQNNPRIHSGRSKLSVQVLHPEGKHCIVCKQINDLKQCGTCHKVRYCSTACQKKHWPEHKKHCTKQ